MIWCFLAMQRPLEACHTKSRGTEWRDRVELGRKIVSSGKWDIEQVVRYWAWNPRATLGKVLARWDGGPRTRGGVWKAIQRHIAKRAPCRCGRGRPARDPLSHQALCELYHLRLCGLTLAQIGKLTGAAPSTIKRRLASIRCAHEDDQCLECGKILGIDDDSQTVSVSERRGERAMERRGFVRQKKQQVKVKHD